MENLYLIKLSNGTESFFKIGLTVHRYCRFYEIMKSGYSVEIIYMMVGVEFYKALDYERILQNTFRKYSYMPKIRFGGYTECFSTIDLDMYKSIIQDIKYKELVVNKQISWR